MPELPEVESVRLGLQKSIAEQNILDIDIRNLKIVSSNSNIRMADKNKGKEFFSNLVNKKIISVKRRAKNIIIDLEDEGIVLIHLKMTGQLVYVPDKNNNKIDKDIVVGGHPIISSYKGDLPGKHTHVIFKLEKGVLYYNDTRSFGYVLYYKNIETAIEFGHFAKLGKEPMDKDFTLGYFNKEIKSKKNQNKILKKVFLDQSIVVGLGNIYADEVCFASGVRGDNYLKNLTDIQIESLYNNIKLILSNAIKLGGSSISDYLLADGSRGNYAREHKVYGKSGEDCIVCNNKLEKSIIAGRTTIYCKMCQK